jgi:hypothetical protein
MVKVLAGAVIAVAIAASAGAARAETCLWLGYWACSDKGYDTHYYYPPAAPNVWLQPAAPAGHPSPDYYGPRPY